jgi:phage FluMu protein Com
MLAGYTWSQVKCPKCEQINETPIDKIYISDWD